MAKIKISKVTAVPTGVAIVADTIYMVSVAADQMEVYMSNSAGDSLRRVLNETDIQALINASISGLGGVEVVDDIAARDALSPTSNLEVFVLDASSDPTVSSGGANYIYRLSNTTWYKQSEAESMDIVLDWNSIINGPSSSAAQIDSAVTNSHTHANKTQLDLIGQDGDGDPTYNGSKIANEYTSTAW